MATWRRRKASDITVMWADFGQGKTHSLLHLMDGVSSEPRDVTIHYVQLPPLTTGSPFVALYRQIMYGFPLDELGARVFTHYQKSPLSLFTDSVRDRTVVQLLWVIGTSSPGKEAATRWLRAEPVTRSALSALSIGGKALVLPPPPKTAQECQNTLDALLRIATDFPSPLVGEVILLVDEFQRIGELSPKKRVEVCDALHLIFNSHPQGLRLVLAFAGGLPEIVEHVLTADLQSRVSSRLNLPPMSVAEGRDYFDALIAAYGHRAVSAEPGDRGAYSAEAVRLILDLAEPSGYNLSPRKINIAADILTNEVLNERGLDGLDPDAPISADEVRAAAERARLELTGSLHGDNVS